MRNESRPERAELESLDIAEDNKEKLKQLFPSVFTETTDEEGNVVESIDFEKLTAELGNFSEVFESRKERYGLDWAGKKDCMKLIQQPSRATLKPAREESINFDTTEHLFIEGDNLEVLKLLQKSYYGKIKMIYIDPPYNTGNDFVYPDDYSDNLRNYLEFSGQVDSEGRKISANTDTSGRYHSNWLNMMYPRLYLARNLLKDDGVIFISIDDNEMYNLKMLCDQIFGEEQLLANIIVQSNKRGQTYKDISKCHEYLLVYYKTDLAFIGELEKRDDALPFNDKHGPFDLWELRNRNPKFNRANRPNLYYPIYVNPTSKTDNELYEISLEKSQNFSIAAFPLNSKGEEGCWRWGKGKLLKEGILGHPKAVWAKRKRDGGWNIYEKSRKSTTKAKSIWLETKVINEQGTVELGRLGMGSQFDFPKPVELVRKAVQLGTSTDDLVLDFFSGSCTSAHAVLDQNKADSENRRFIMVQLPEPLDGTEKKEKDNKEAIEFCDANGFPRNIAELSKERIRRVIKQFEQEREEEEAESAGTLPTMKEEKPELDLGFKVFKLAESNFRIWDGSKVDASEQELKQQLDMHTDNIINTSPEDILYELLLKAGFQPTVKIETKTLADKTVYSIAEGALLICLEDEITKELIDAIASEEPMQFICLDKGFKGNDQLKANAVQTFTARNQGRDKAQQIIFRTV